MDRTVDAVVIGAGHQGLVAAASLADAGYRVCVLEAAGRPGGATRSAEVTEPGSVHDLCATNLNQFIGSPFYGRHRQELEQHGLELAHSGRPFASVFPDGTSLKVTCTPAETEAAFAERSPRDLEGWQFLQRLFVDVAPAYGALSSHPLPSRGSLGAARALWRTRRSTPPDVLARTLLSSTRALGERHFGSPEARALLAAWGMHLDYAPDITGGALFPLLECVGDAAQGMVVARGGISRLPEALVAMIEARGGTVRCGARVEGIELVGRRARTVRLADGERVTALRGVISTASLPQTVQLLHGAADSAMVSSAAGYRFGPGTLMVHLTLDGPLPWNDPGLAGFAYVHQGGYVDDMARTFQQASAGLLPDRPLVVVGQTSTVDPTRTPDPRHQVVWLQVRMVPAQIAGDATGTIEARTWEEAREPFTERVLDLLEQNAPGLRSRIVGRRAFSPEDLEALDANLVGGDTGSGSHQLDQFLAWRPSVRFNRYRTPVPGLYLAGAGTWPGGGVNAVSGDLAAHALRRHEGRPPQQAAGPQSRPTRIATRTTSSRSTPAGPRTAVRSGKR